MTYFKYDCVKLCCGNNYIMGNYTVREVLIKNRTRVWRNVYNTVSA